MPLQIQKLLLEVLWFQEYKDDFSFVYITANHKKCPPMQWQGQLLLLPEEYFPGELPGEEDCDGPGQERRNTSNSHSSSRMEDTLLARSRLSFYQSTSLQQLVRHCIYLIYIFQIQIFRLWLGLAATAAAAQKLCDLSI